MNIQVFHNFETILTLNIFQLIIKNLQSFLELCSLFSVEVIESLRVDLKRSVNDLIKQIIDIRNKEIDNFLDFCQLAIKFYQLTGKCAKNSGKTE